VAGWPSGWPACWPISAGFEEGASWLVGAWSPTGLARLATRCHDLVLELHDATDQLVGSHQRCADRPTNTGFSMKGLGSRRSYLDSRPGQYFDMSQ
jgi:hypothetical protein